MRLFNWFLLIIILIMMLMGIFYIQRFNPPTKAEVESFLGESIFIDRYHTETKYEDEYFSASYLRRHTALFFGQIYIVPKFTFLFVYTPFHHFNYINPISSESHTYLYVETKDKGVLAYNPVNGNFVGSYNKLMLEMGCEFSTSGDLYLANQDCMFVIQKRQLDQLIEKINP